MVSKIITFGIAVAISAVISYFWVNAIDEQKKYEQDNPDYDRDAGWLE